MRQIRLAQGVAQLRALARQRRPRIAGALLLGAIALFALVPGLASLRKPAGPEPAQLEAPPGLEETPFPTAPAHAG